MRKILFLATLLISSLSAEEIPTLPSPLAEIQDDTLLAANVSASDSKLLEFGPDEREDNDQFVLRDFIQSKGLIECRQKSGLLTIAGDARARWLSATETVNHKHTRHFDPKVIDKNRAVNRFRSEVNLFLDYVADCSWVSTKLRWSNLNGIDGGTPTKVDLDRAFIGYDVYATDDTDFYVEIGRSDLSYMFESRVQFGSLFNGIHLYYTRCLPDFCTLVVHGGPFIVDAYTQHYPWVAEFFLMGILDSYWNIKYTIVDWKRFKTLNYGNDTESGKATVENHPRYDFIISQLIIGYQREIDIFHCKTFYGYAAVLANHAAKKRFTTENRYLNHAWYTGFTLGKLCKACDWSLDINYQNVQVQAIPEFDLSGIGHGNVEGLLFTDGVLRREFPKLARGFSNYQGWCATALFAMTDSMSLRAIAQESWPRNKSIGGDFHYKCFEMAVIYAW